jgi:hypothetical protein
MNKPSRPTPPFAPASPPYELDGYGWAFAQAELLRQRRFDEVDLDHIIDEIETVGRSEWRTVRSALRVLSMHILKWQHQPERRSRSWALSIAGQRLAYEQAISSNPSLRPHLDEILHEAHERARLEASRDTDLPLKTFPVEPLDWSVILDEPFEIDPD